MATVPTKPSQNLLPAMLAVTPLYALRVFVINPFLAFTTFFPFVVLMQGTSFQGIYVTVLSFLIHILFNKTIEGVSGGNLLTLFFIFIFVLALVIRLIEHAFRGSGLDVSIDWRHAVALMTVVYAVAWLLNRGNPDTPEPIFLLMLYLFNVYSIFSYHILEIAFEKLRLLQPILGRFI